MIDLTKIKSINSVIAAYFKKNKKKAIIPVKELMPAFIEAGIFVKDFKNGKPIREILRELDSTNQRELIPFLHSEEKDNNIYWYFIPANAPTPTTPYKQEQTFQSKKELAEIARSLSDESYIIDLCDEILGQKAERQKRFDFLLGDLHKDGKSRTKLPVDAYYYALSLVVEYREFEDSTIETSSNADETKTVSGVSRLQQRKIYDKRRAAELPKHGIKMIEIPYEIFDCNEQNKIVRNIKEDTKKLTELLNNEGFYFTSK
ncbi:MAG: hypothetical protein WCK02_13115 [Bacteroidota bacterium]